MSIQAEMVELGEAFKATLGPLRQMAAFLTPISDEMQRQADEAKEIANEIQAAKEAQMAAEREAAQAAYEQAAAIQAAQAAQDAAFKKMTKIIGGFFKATAAGIKSALGPFGFLIDILDGLGILQPFLDILGAFIDILGLAFMPVVELLTPILIELLEPFMELSEAIAPLIALLIQTAMQLLSVDEIMAVFVLLIGGLAAGIQFITPIIESIIGAFMHLRETALAPLFDLFGMIMDFDLDGIIDWFMDLPSIILDTLEDLMSDVIDTIMGIGGWLIDLFRGGGR